MPSLSLSLTGTHTHAHTVFSTCQGFHKHTVPCIRKSSSVKLFGVQSECEREREAGQSNRSSPPRLPSESHTPALKWYLKICSYEIILGLKECFFTIWCLFLGCNALAITSIYWESLIHVAKKQSNTSVAYFDLSYSCPSCGTDVFLF